MLIREVRASNAEGDALVVALHPELTFVTGLLPDEQVELADILASVVYGRTDGLGGRVELGGAEMDVGVWGLTVGEDLDDLDIFVRRSDVSGAAERALASVNAPDRMAALRDAVAHAQEAAAEADRELDAARQRAAEARAAVAALGPSPAAPPVAPAPAEDPVAALRRAVAAAENALDEARREVEAAGRDEVLAAEQAAAAESARVAAEQSLAEAAAAEAEAVRVEEEAGAAVARAAVDINARPGDGLAEGASPGTDIDELEAAVTAARAGLADARLAHRFAGDMAAARADALEAARRALAAARRDVEEAEAAVTAAGPQSGDDKSPDDDSPDDDSPDDDNPDAHGPEVRNHEEPDGTEQELLRAAEAAMAEAEVAAAEAARAAQAVERVAALLEAARAAADSPEPVDDELEALERRAIEVQTELARARAEESLFAGFAHTNRTPDWNEGGGGRAGRGARRAANRRAPEADGPAGATVTDAELADVEAEARRATARAGELRAAADAMSRHAEVVGDKGRDLRDRRAAAAARLDELEHELAALGVPVDVGPVAAALSALRNIPAPADREDARRLLTEVDALLTSRGAMKVRAAPTWLVDAARTALEEARVELARAEEMARPMRVSAEVAAEFESAHAAVLDAEAKADRRFGGMMARRRLEKAVADERELLLKFGLPSYTAFLLRTMPISSDSAGARHLADARRAMADAEAVWEELHQAEYPEELAALEQQEARVLAEAAAVLGPERMGAADASSPAATLRSVRALLVETTESDTDVHAATRHLSDAVAALASAHEGGGPGPEGLETEALVAIAEERIAAEEVTAARRGALAAEIEALGAEIGELDRTASIVAEAASPDRTAIAAAEQEALEAEAAATEARTRLEAAAIAAGIAPAAAAVAADAEVLDAEELDAVSGLSEPEDLTGDRAADAGGSGGTGVDWEAQADAEVEQSKREIEALEAELVAIDERRTVLLGAETPVGDAGVRPERIESLAAELAAAEDDLARARARADDAAALAAVAIEPLEPEPEAHAEPGSAADSPNPGGAVARHRAAAAEARARLEAAEAAAAELEVEVGAAADEVAVAAEAAERAELVTADAEERLAAARTEAAAAEAALIVARQAHDQAEAAHRDAQAARRDAEARRAAAEQELRDATGRRADAEAGCDRARARSASAESDRDRLQAAHDEVAFELLTAEEERAIRADEARIAAEQAEREATERAERWHELHAVAVAAEERASEEETAATRRVVEARAALDAARARLQEAEGAAAQSGASVRAAAVEEFVTERLATARSREQYGTVPLILLDPFDPEVLGQVASLLAGGTGGVQVVYLTEEVDVLQWAATFGPERATVLRFGDPLPTQG